MAWLGSAAVLCLGVVIGFIPDGRARANQPVVAEPPGEQQDAEGGPVR